MGYTHYWTVTQPFTDAQWDRLPRAAKLVLSTSGSPVAFESDTTRKPLVDHELIRFNGVGEDGHETFLFNRAPGGELCKTARKPYDALVVSILSFAKTIAPDSIRIESDGSLEELKASIRTIPGRDPKVAAELAAILGLSVLS